MEKPTNGFYYHFKHNPNILNDHAYEVLGISLHTETSEYLVTYRPLYKNTFLENADFCVRPLPMFLENVKKEGKVIPRFQKISDPKIIEELEKIKKEMY